MTPLTPTESLWTRLNRRRVLAFVMLLLSVALTGAWAKFEQEQLMLETQIQEKIERILSKTLPASQYLVTVKVEMDQRATAPSVRTNSTRQPGRNPFMDENRFVLPGVPQKKEFVETQGTESRETVTTGPSAEALIRRISVSVLVAPETAPEQIRAIREVITVNIPFNPLRGDEMEITPSPLLAKAVPSETGGQPASVALPKQPVKSGLAAIASDRMLMILFVLLATVSIILLILVIFLFGPVRAFLNRLLAVLPRVGEQAAYAVNNASARPNGNGATGALNGGANGHHPASHSRNGHPDLPFQFIREEQLVKLPLLLKQMQPAEAAIVLAYLAPEWASRVLAGLDGGLQSALVRELSQAREIPAESVKAVEAQLKAKLPYWVGGRDWVDSVYQLTQPQAQKNLLGSLNQQAPDLAQSLRKKSFFFEDIAVLTPGALRVLLQEVSYPVAAQALKDEKAEFREAMLKRLPAAMREIIEQELELSLEDRTAAADAKGKVVTLARQLIADGRIVFGERPK